MKIVHLLKTKSLLSDGRVLKWTASLKNNEIKSHLIVLEDKNKVESYSLDDKIKVDCIKLNSRSIFPKRRGYVFKIIELLFITRKALKNSNAEAFVFHDVQHYLTLFIYCLTKQEGRGTPKLIWDLHELPHMFLSKYYISRKFIQFLLSKVDLVVYTNSWRRECILNNFPFEEKDYVILNNYPNKTYSEHPKASLPTYLKEWLKGRDYILWMGAANRARNFLPVLKCFEKLNKDLTLVVMGAMDADMESYVKKNNLSHRVFSRFVKQNEIIQFVDNALFSYVFYKQNSKNNLFCEPNRLYQLITRGIPVIVGNNPPMKSVVDQYDAGIVLPDDGSDYKTLFIATQKLLSQISEEKFVSLENEIHRDLNWDKQFLNVSDSIRAMCK